MLRASIILFVLGILTFCNVTIANEYTLADLEKVIQEHKKTYYIHRVGNTIYTVADFRNISGTLDEPGKCPSYKNLVRAAVSVLNKVTVSFFRRL